MLEIRDLHVHYGAIAALHGISLTIEQGSIVTLIGANGAGKSTTLRAISGVVKSRSGSVKFLNEEITNEPAHEIVARGLAHVPEGRMVFANLTVHENLLMGGYLRKDRRLYERHGVYLRHLSAAEGAPKAGCRHTLRWRATDACNRSRA